MNIFHKCHHFLRVEAIAFVLLGALAIAIPEFTSYSISNFFGWIFLLASGFQGMRLMTCFKQPAFWPSLMYFFITLILAIILLGYPLTALYFHSGTPFFTILFLIFFLIDGVIKIMLGFFYRRFENWKWLLVSGAISLGLAFIIAAGWPSTPTWEIGLLVGFNMICYGFALLYLTANN